MDAKLLRYIRSCAEFEGDYLNLYERLIGKPVIPVGLLPQEKPERKQFTDGRWGGIFKWLDDQKSKSVVFVGFGSEYKLTKDQVYEIVHGVELSGLPFLWALKKPGWAIDDRDSLPSGFHEKISDRGIVCMGWAPQLEILCHPSIGEGKSLREKASEAAALFRNLKLRRGYYISAKTKCLKDTVTSRREDLIIAHARDFI
ncbi:UDP-rhamnose:rhamnosyltransferase [Salix suchowensis]|nr:UDP-rhamnose:rhamnosyltransferase [Salix suchowensis]